MVEEPTCLLLGAGASAHLGFPLGAALKDLMVRELQSDIFTDNTAPNMGIPRDVISSTDHVNFCHQLGFGGWPSPDAFLERHPEHNALGKHMIASLLRGHERENLLMTQQRGWYTTLMNVLLADTLDEFRKNRLSIVTFNYDRSIDCLVHRLVQHRYGIQSDAAWQFVSEVIPIVHVHGTLGPYPDVPYGKHERSTADAANAIKIISEVQDDTPEFRAATRCLEDAKRIIVVGFAFATQNVDRLRFFSAESIESRTVRIVNGHIGQPGVDDEFIEWIAQWGFTREHLVDGLANWAFDRKNLFHN